MTSQFGNVPVHIWPLPPQKRRTVVPGALAQDCCICRAPAIPDPRGAPTGLWMAQRFTLLPAARMLAGVVPIPISRSLIRPVFDVPSVIEAIVTGAQVAVG